MAAARATPGARSGTDVLGSVTVVSTDRRFLAPEWSPQLQRYRIAIDVASEDELVDRAQRCDVVVLPMTGTTSAASLGLVEQLARSGTPILLGVQPGWEEPAAEALHRGAHSFVVLPYRRTSLVRRLRLLATPAPRAEAAACTTLAGGRVVVDLRRRELTVDGRPAPVPPREFDLLRLLIERADQVVTAEEILTRLWPGGAGTSNSLAVHVRRLRERVEVDASRPMLVCTVRGVGYRLGTPPGT